MSEEEFVCRYTVKDGKVVLEDAVPLSFFSCTILTCSSLIFLLAFALGVSCGILFS